MIENFYDNFYDERAMLQEEMQMLKEERMRQNRRMEEIRARLAELDEKRPMEQREHKNQQRFIAAFDRFSESLDLFRNMIDKVAPELTFEQILEVRKKDAQLFHSMIEETTTTTTNSSRTFVSNHQEHENIKTLKESRRNIEKDSRLVASILKEKGIPVKLKDLIDILEERHGISYSNPTNVLNKMMNYEPRLERVTRGVYQFNTSFCAD